MNHCKTGFHHFGVLKYLVAMWKESVPLIPTLLYITTNKRLRNA